MSGAEPPGAGPASAGEPLLQLRDVSVFLPRGDALWSELNVALRSGEVLGILGANGSGKTSFLGALMGQHARLTGDVCYRGTPVLPARDWAFRAACGVVFQRPSLDDKLTVRENLELAAALYGLGRSEAAARVTSGLAESGLEDLTHRRAATLSGGEARRVDLVRAMLHSPALLVLDEPTVGLDERAFRQYWSHLDHLVRQRSVAVIAATHRAAEAERCNRLVLLARGRSPHVTTPDALRSIIERDIVETDGVPFEVLVAACQPWACTPLRTGELRAAFHLDDAPRWVPELARTLSPLGLRSISIRRPDLADAFDRIMGSRLDPPPTPLEGQA